MRPLATSVRTAVIGLAFFTAAPLAQADDKEPRRSITVSASGTVSVEPDQARITSGVTADGASAREALTNNTAAMQKVIAGLKESGTDPKDIQTASFRVEPRYTRPIEGQAPKIDGYSVTNEVQVLVRDLDKLGDILDRLVTAGANQTAGLNFEVSKAETLLDEARQQAVANALRRAKLYAAAAGAEVGEVLTIVEGGGEGPRPMVMERAMKAEAVPIERGTETLAANVTITWALK
ncbi:MAG: SIMPL domain-containing protein [Hyphomicrobium sp.]|nr:SIMPL domain-containing protein [Hyphomicrobium sp.]